MAWFYFYSNKIANEPQMKNESNNTKKEKPSKVLTSDPVYFESTRGFFARPNDQDEHPGVVMIHEWWGLNDNIRRMAEELAHEDYLVLAVDLFGKVATTPDEARAQVEALDQDRATQNLRAAVAFLEGHGSMRVGSLGWCFGGGQSLQLAISGEPLDATVIYYGQLTDDKEKLSSIYWPVLGIFGEEDSSILVDSVNDFQAALDGLDIENEIYIYPGVGHAFANPSGDNYAQAEAEDAWAKTKDFLEANLK